MFGVDPIHPYQDPIHADGSASESVRLGFNRAILDRIGRWQRVPLLGQRLSQLRPHDRRRLLELERLDLAMTRVLVTLLRRIDAARADQEQKQGRPHGPVYERAAIIFGTAPEKRYASPFRTEPVQRALAVSVRHAPRYFAVVARPVRALEDVAPGTIAHHYGRIEHVRLATST